MAAVRGDLPAADRGVHGGLCPVGSHRASYIQAGHALHTDDRSCGNFVRHFIGIPCGHPSKGISDLPGSGPRTRRGRGSSYRQSHDPSYGDFHGPARYTSRAGEPGKAPLFRKRPARAPDGNTGPPDACDREFPHRSFPPDVADDHHRARFRLIGGCVMHHTRDPGPSADGPYRRAEHSWRRAHAEEDLYPHHQRSRTGIRPCSGNTGQAQRGPGGHERRFDHVRYFHADP